MYRLAFGFLAFIIILFSICSCERSDKNINNGVVKETKRVIVDDRNFSQTVIVKILEIDGCEYVYYQMYPYSGLAHKGNCKYCKGDKNEN